MANETQELTRLLHARDTRMFSNPTNQTARLPIFSHDGPAPLAPDSRLAYIACTTLRDLATAENDILWEVYGDIISKWKGSTTQGILESLREQYNWVQEFRHRTDPVDIARTISNIRKTLATLNLEHVPSISLPAFATHVSEEVEVLKSVIALHHRSEKDKNTIYILPFLPRIEQLIEASLLSPGLGFDPGHDFDVAVISTAKAMVHESRHVVGTLVSLILSIYWPCH